MTIAYRWATPADFEALGPLMYDTVRTGPSRYTEAQRAAWVSEVPGGDRWSTRLGNQQIALATQDGAVMGFVTLRPDGYVDFAYVHPSAQGQGVFRRLYQMIEQVARDAGLTELSAHASLMAQGPFGAMGFAIVTHEIVTRGSESLPRAEMHKSLCATP